MMSWLFCSITGYLCTCPPPGSHTGRTSPHKALGGGCGGLDEGDGVQEGGRGGGRDGGRGGGRGDIPLGEHRMMPGARRGVQGSSYLYWSPPYHKWHTKSP